MTQEGGNSYLPIYDAMGNVHGMIKASDGSLAAAYEYDAFGNTLRESGTYAPSNPFRYSTKYTDIETGLVYYGHRYYSPSLGRFINKDPIAESGGLNLYGYCGNNGVNGFDYLGMFHYDEQGRTVYDAADIDRIRQTYDGRSNYGFFGYGASLTDQMNQMNSSTGVGLYAAERTVTVNGNHYTVSTNGSITSHTDGGDLSFVPQANGGYSIASDDFNGYTVNATLTVGGNSTLVTGFIGERVVTSNAPNSVESIGGGGGGTSTMSGVSAAGAAKLLAEYGKYLKPIQLYGTPGEAFISGALRAATMTDSEYDTNEYTWGVVKNAGGKFYSTFPTTDHSDHFAMVTNNPGIMKAYDNGTLVLIGHNHPPGPMPGELSGYGHGGFLDRGRGDQMVTATYHVPIVAIDPWGYSHAGTAFNDNVSIPGIDLSGANFNNMVTIMRGR